MHTVKGIYENGQIVLPEGQYPPGRQDVIVLFPDEAYPAPDTTAGERFVKKWEGILEGCSLDDWQAQKADDLLRKHR